MKEIEVSYADETGALVRITKDDVVKYISTDESVTEKEVFMFLNMCKYLRLNPFLREIYLVKYRGAPATFVISYQTLLRRVSQDPNFDGYEVKMEGTIPDMTGTAIVYRKDRSKPVVVSVKYSEAVKKTLDGAGKIVPTKMWQEMPEWMLRKVALARALREAFPNAIGNGVVSDAEVGEGAGSPAPEKSETSIEAPAKTSETSIETSAETSETPASETPESPETPVETTAGTKEALEPEGEPPSPESQPEPSDLSLKEILYSILKEKNISKLSEVKALLSEVFPNENFEKIGKYIFENMPEEKLKKVIEYLSK